MNTDQKLWLVSRYDENDPTIFEVCGIFDDEAKALALCTTWEFGLGPLKLNEDLTKTSGTDWEGFYYPIHRDK
jgi:hypothetical protein